MLDVFTQHQSGLLNDEQFNGVCGTYRVWLREPGFRRLMIERNTAFRGVQPGFVAFIETLMNDETRASS